jgi:hypothetical protein
MFGTCTSPFQAGLLLYWRQNVVQHHINKEICTKKKNSVVLVRKRTVPTDRPPHVGEVSANFLRIEGVAWSAQRIPTAIFSVF